MREIQQAFIPLIGTRRIFFLTDGTVIGAEIGAAFAQYLRVLAVKEITSYTLAAPTMGVSWGAAVVQQILYQNIARTMPIPATGWGAA